MQVSRIGTHRFLLYTSELFNIGVYVNNINSTKLMGNIVSNTQYYFTTNTKPLFSSTQLNSKEGSFSNNLNENKTTNTLKNSKLNFEPNPDCIEYLKLLPNSSNHYAVIGLGNFGNIFQDTRHNIGRDIVDFLCKSHYKTDYISWKKTHHCKHTEPISLENKAGLYSNKSVILACPESFMNTCGPYITKFIETYQIPIQNLIIIYDDIDIPCGEIRIRYKGSSGGQNGVKSLLESLNYLKLTPNIKSTAELPFVRIRIGIGRPSNNIRILGVNQHVLGQFTGEEKQRIRKLKFTVADCIEMIIDQGVQKAMNTFNVKLKK